MLETKTARDCMSDVVISFRPEMDVLEALRVLVELDISGAPVLDRLGNLVGMLTERDCMKIALAAGYHGEAGGQVSEFMCTDLETVDEDTTMIEVAERFVDYPHRCLPVLKDGRLVGMLSRRDLLNLLEACWQPDGKRA